MDPSVALLFSIIFILVALRVKKNVTLAIILGAFLLGFLTLGKTTFTLFLDTLTSFETLRLLIIIISAFTLGFSMQELGLLKRLCECVEALFGKFSLILLPALVGLLPMPGGALVSAVMIKDLVDKQGLSPEKATFLNYWCRHLWIPIWPLFPSFVLAASIVEVHYLKVILANYLITLFMIFISVTFLRSFFSFKGKREFSFSYLKDFLTSFYPIIVVIVFSLVLHIKLVFVLPSVVVVLMLHKKPSLTRLKKIFSKTLDPEILILVVGVLFYKNLIIASHSATLFFYHLKSMHIPPAIASFILAFIIGIAVGIEVGFAAIVLPLLAEFTGFAGSFHPLNFMLVFGGGFMGIMMSPLHLCLVLTAKYYNANLNKVYKSLAPAVLLVCLLLWAVFVIKS